MLEIANTDIAVVAVGKHMGRSATDSGLENGTVFLRFGPRGGGHMTPNQNGS